MNPRKIFRASSVIELLTGVALIAAPAVVISLLFNSTVTLAGQTVARALGVGLVAIGIITFESANTPVRFSSRVGLCFYNLAASLVFAHFGATSPSYGLLLWPVVGLHAIMGVAMLGAVIRSIRREN